MLNIPIAFGTIVNKVGGGSGTAQLTTSYTPGTTINVGGIGNLASRCTVALGTSTATYFRVMDYTDPASPRPLLSTVPDDGLGNVIEHVVKPAPAAGELAAGSFMLQCDLGGVSPAVAIEVKGTGVFTTADTFVAAATAFQAQS